MRRYSRLRKIGNETRFETSYVLPIIRDNIANGNIRVVGRTLLQERQRLDTLAGQLWGDGSLWWVLAAASNIGWGLQVPPGTIIIIPDMGDIVRYIGE